MTNSQRRIVGTWVATLALVLAVVVFESWVLAQWSWLQFVALGLIIVAIWAKPAVSRGNGFSRAVERYPLLKVWFALCAVAALGFFALTSIWHVRIDQTIGLRGLIGIFAILLVPPIIAIERERFEAAGKGDASNAI